MRESLGSIALYNIIIVFIVVTFAVLAGTMSYSKAFKVNNRIVNAIEKYEGYNELSKDLIDRDLISIGYESQNPNRIYNCRKRNGYMAMENLNTNYNLCIYEMPLETSEWNGRYFEYGVLSYIYLDFPLIGEFIRIPVYGVSRKVFKFNDSYSPSISINRYLDADYNSLGQENIRLNGNDNWLTFENAPATIREYVVVSLKDSTGGYIGWEEYNEKLSDVKGACGDGYKCCKATFSTSVYPNVAPASLIYRIKNGNCS